MSTADPRSDARRAVEREPGQRNGLDRPGRTRTRRRRRTAPAQRRRSAHWHCGRAIPKRWRGWAARSGCWAIAIAPWPACALPPPTRPSTPASRSGSAHALEDSGEAEAAADAYARAHALAPQEPQLAAYLLAWRRKLCDWRELEALVATGARRGPRRPRRGRAVRVPERGRAAPPNSCNARACGRRRSRVRYGRCHRRRPGPATASIRAGFLSNGFGAHPTGLLTVALFEALQSHQRHRGPPVRAQPRRRQPDPPAPARRGARPARCRRAAARTGGRTHPRGRHRRAVRPARLGRRRRAGSAGDASRAGAGELARLPGTSGAPWIDYVLADRFVLPESLAAHFSETVAWLPRCFQPSDTARVIPPAPARADCGLPERLDDGAASCSAASTTATSSTRAACRAPWRCCAACPAACCGCCPGRARPMRACARSPRRRGSIRSGWCSCASSRTRTTWRGCSMPTCSSTPSPTTPTPPPPMRCGPAARC